MSDKQKILDNIRSFQLEMENVEILKSTEAYGYNYADLPSILKVIHPVLLKHKLWYNHTTKYDRESKQNVLETVIYCIDDNEDFIYSSTIIDREATLAKMNRFMIEGSALTYFRRYHLVTMLGLLTDEDHDAGGKRTKPGRSVETATVSEVNFVAIFEKQAKTKTKQQFQKTFDAYKSQMNNDDIKAVEKIFKDKYGS
jgi:hypothetical protein